MARTSPVFRPLATHLQTLCSLGEKSVWTAIWHHFKQASHQQSKSVASLDSTSIRVHQHGSPKKKRRSDDMVGTSRGGKTTKLHLVAGQAQSGTWRVMAARITCGQQHDILSAPTLVDKASSDVEVLAAGRAYDSKHLRDTIRRAEFVAAIPKRTFGKPRKEHQVPPGYRDRNVVERVFARLKQFRRIATRFDRPAKHFASTVAVALSLLELPSPSTRAGKKTA